MELLVDELELLGLSTTSAPTVKDLRKAFKKKSIIHLPEKHPDSPKAHSTFEKLNDAFVKVGFEMFLKFTRPPTVKTFASLCRQRIGFKLFVKLYLYYF